ncbi:hypothetical protein DFJ74DRAFT_703497 [Hyaloraphidium curvatum]|nr:hypothetical protein DFJ74DRAFT_703497 [Hyaloraphidium curvatum]
MSGRPAARPACVTCSDGHKRCEYAPGDLDGPCLRCARLKRACTPQAPFRAGPAKSRPAGAAKGASRPAPPSVATGAPAGAGSDAPLSASRTSPLTASPIGLSPVSPAWNPGSPLAEEQARILAETPPSTADSGAGSDSHDTADLLRDPVLVFACIESYYTNVNFVNGLVHRETFEAAFVDSADVPGLGAAVYGPARPSALLCAMASNGIMTADHLGITPLDRWNLGAAYAARADLLLASPAQNGLTDLEIAQACNLLSRFYVGCMRASDAVRVLNTAAKAILRIVDPQRSNAGIDVQPRTPSDLIYWEMVIRVAGQVHGAMAAYQLAQSSDLEYLELGHRPRPVPFHDIYFLIPLSGAFPLLTTAPNRPARHLFDPAPFLLEKEGDPERCRQTVRSLVSSIFRFRSSRLVLVNLVTTFTSMVVEIRKRAAALNLDLAVLASADPALDSPEAAKLRADADLVVDLVGECYLGMPEDIGPALSAGDPTPLFARAQELLGDLRFAHAVVSSMITLHSMPIVCWIQTVPKQIPAGFFFSAQLGKVLDRGVAAARLMEAQLRADPKLGSVHQNVFTASIKIGALAAAVFASAGDEVPGAHGDALVAARYVAAFAAHYPISGIKAAKQFFALLAASGVDVDPETLAVGAKRAKAEEAGKDLEGFFARIVITDNINKDLFEPRAGKEVDGE